MCISTWIKSKVGKASFDALPGVEGSHQGRSRQTQGKEAGNRGELPHFPLVVCIDPDSAKKRWGKIEQVLFRFNCVGCPRKQNISNPEAPGLKLPDKSICHSAGAGWALPVCKKLGRKLRPLHFSADVSGAPGGSQTRMGKCAW